MLLLAASQATTSFRALLLGHFPSLVYLGSACSLALCTNDIAMKNYRCADKNACWVFPSSCAVGS